jgi:hypothetical protein
MGIPAERKASKRSSNSWRVCFRSAVIARKLSFGDQSGWGGQLVARLMTLITSQEQQGRDAMVFIRDAMVFIIELIDANRENRP